MASYADAPNVYEDSEELSRLLLEVGPKPCEVTTVRAIVRERILVDIRGGSCERCGYNKNPAALDFHHTGKKTFGVSWAIQYFTEQQFEEVAIPEVKGNTILLCSNCHREEHHPDRQVVANMLCIVSTAFYNMPNLIGDLTNVVGVDTMIFGF